MEQGIKPHPASPNPLMYSFRPTISDSYARISRKLRLFNDSIFSITELIREFTMPKLVLSSLLGLSAALGVTTVAWGHSVQTDYFVDLFAAELSLDFTATYSSGEPMQAADVFVYAPGDRETPWLKSKTDETGNFTFLPDESLQGEWRIEFEKDGHQDILMVPVDENGIDYMNIGQVETSDVHYAELTPGAIGVLSVVSLGVLGLAVRQKLSKAG